MNSTRQVTEAEMRAHIKAWPRKLQADVYGAAEPPYVTFNDFTYGYWPDSIVASYVAPGLDYATEKETPASKFSIHRELDEADMSGEQEQ